MKRLQKLYFSSHSNDSDPVWNRLSQDPNNEWLLIRIAAELKHRLEIMDIEQEYVDTLDIRGLNGLSIHEWKEEEQDVLKPRAAREKWKFIREYNQNKKLHCGYSSF